MLVSIHTVFSLLGNHLWETTTAVLAFLSVALATYARDQVREGTNWILAPITRLFPWNRRSDSIPEYQEGLISDFTLVDVFLFDTEGKLARYQKTTSYVVSTSELSSYQEGVTAEGHAEGFITMRGTIIETVKEHGFYISRIDLGEVIQKGARLTNVYMADLYYCFTKSEEHWTQELAFRTKHLTLQIHFPAARPPKSVACKAVEGTRDKPAKTTARLVDLYREHSIIWEIERPKLNDIYKLEWIW